ncbi:hemin uptake protein HemP [Thiocystis violacea]|uniref:hemin uptake protein HemP n=1 Tax=Thiocystis violacea TaxID=13725 RepID=UPI001905BA8D|nr:hemin uptake protein HemP [Thiocystis violacea]MBK1718259.1 hemin transporter [Thiocystis violacea]
MPSASSSESPFQPTARDRHAYPQPRRVDSNSLLGGQNLLMIEHAGCSYYLRMTRNNKLILTK